MITFRVRVTSTRRIVIPVGEALLFVKADYIQIERATERPALTRRSPSVNKLLINFRTTLKL